MPDLFGNPDLEPAPLHPVGGYAARPGTGPRGETCKTCVHAWARRHQRTYWKCDLVTPTSGARNRHQAQVASVRAVGEENMKHYAGQGWTCFEEMVECRRSTFRPIASVIEEITGHRAFSGRDGLPYRLAELGHREVGCAMIPHPMLRPVFFNHRGDTYYYESDYLRFAAMARRNLRWAERRHRREVREVARWQEASAILRAVRKYLKQKSSPRA